MKIEIADKAGFCFGVDRAVKIAYALSKEEGNHVTYGMLIHNRDFTEDLADRGVGKIDSVEEITEGMQVVIRAHGIGQAEQELILARGAEVVDATCPYVKKIHNIVKKADEAERTVIICGNENHPEVKGINGWCRNSAIVINGEGEIEKLLSIDADIPVTVVAQTTIRKPFLKKVSEITKKHFTNAEIFDTICNATAERQIAAAELARRCDCMIVVGGKNSSNTRMLYDVCKENCEDTYCIENAKELKNYINKGIIPENKNLKVRITAGASTPDSVIKEVYFTMAGNNEMNFAEALEET